MSPCGVPVWGLYGLVTALGKPHLLWESGQVGIWLGSPWERHHPFSVSVPLNTGNLSMASGQRKPKVLETMIKSFKNGFSGDCEVKRHPGKLRILCELEWPTFEIGCLQKGHWMSHQSGGEGDLETGAQDSWLEIAPTLPP